MSNNSESTVDVEEDSLLENDSFTEEQYVERVERDIEKAGKEFKRKSALSESSQQERKKRLQSWNVAIDIVKQFRPVPSSVWRLIYQVFGRENGLTESTPLSFHTVKLLITKAAQDETLAINHAKPDGIDIKAPSYKLTKAVMDIGIDVAAACCYLHAISRRIDSLVDERIWHPLVDDALLRAKIGHFVGGTLPQFGYGRGMLAGFSGRAGLVIQIATGTKKQCTRALEHMARGVPMRNVCFKIYGCDPLEVAAISLVASGCGRDSALGIAGASMKNNTVVSDPNQFLWLAVTSLVEHLRMGTPSEVDEKCWNAFGYSDKRRKDIIETIRRLQRKKHGWNWITLTQSAMEV
ncbi:MAG: hypothetical protein IT291_10000 [Deltaproteobacteria bacterium]|nr:hypothetical protein [Deltaproteobacteria bacterium]